MSCSVMFVGSAVKSSVSVVVKKAMEREQGKNRSPGRESTRVPVSVVFIEGVLRIGTKKRD